MGNDTSSPNITYRVEKMFAVYKNGNKCMLYHTGDFCYVKEQKKTSMYLINYSLDKYANEIVEKLRLTNIPSPTFNNYYIEKYNPPIDKNIHPLIRPEYRHTSYLRRICDSKNRCHPQYVLITAGVLT